MRLMYHLWREQREVIHCSATASYLCGGSDCTQAYVASYTRGVVKALVASKSQELQNMMCEVVPAVRAFALEQLARDQLWMSFSARTASREMKVSALRAAHPGITDEQLLENPGVSADVDAFAAARQMYFARISVDIVEAHPVLRPDGTNWFTSGDVYDDVHRDDLAHSSQPTLKDLDGARAILDAVGPIGSDHMSQFIGHGKEIAQTAEEMFPTSDASKRALLSVLRRSQRISMMHYIHTLMEQNSAQKRK